MSNPSDRKHAAYPNGTWWHVTTADNPEAAPYGIYDTHDEATAAAERAKAAGHRNVKITTSKPRSAR